MKFLNDHAINKAANAILNRFAQTNGKAKNISAKVPIYIMNLPGKPKLVPVELQPVIVKFFDSIITNGCVVK